MGKYNYTKNNINFYQVGGYGGTFKGTRLGSFNGAYTVSGTSDITSINYTTFNAVDIDWNAAEISNGNRYKAINTTTDLLKFIEDLDARITALES